MGPLVGGLERHPGQLVRNVSVLLPGGTSLLGFSLIILSSTNVGLEGTVGIGHIFEKNRLAVPGIEASISCSTT